MTFRLLAPPWPTALVVLGALSCAGDRATPSRASAPSPQDRPCTKIGCQNGLQIELVRPTPWPPGSYRLTLGIDGKRVSCEGSLPLPACDAGPGFQCEDDSLTLGESGCALPPEQHGIASLNSTATEGSDVSLTIEHDGALNATAKLRPAFQDVQPNGPGCEPVCRNAGLRLNLR